MTARICPKCKAPQQNGGDFCADPACDEYLVWAGTPARAAAATPQAPQRATPKRRLPRKLPRPPAGPPTPPHAAPAAGHPLRAVIALLEEGEGDGTLAVEPGRKLELRGRVRNQSKIVDSYKLAVEDLPEQWWTIEPATLHLLPFETSERPEEEFKVTVTPPRSPAAKEGYWPIHIAATSGADKRQVRASYTLRLEPFEDVKIAVQPERTAGRRRGHLVATVTNASNHDVEASLSGSDKDGQCHFYFKSAPAGPARGLALKTRVRRLLARVRRPRAKVLELALPRGEELQADLFVYPKKALLLGSTINHELTLLVTPSGAGEAEREDRKLSHAGIFRQRAWLPLWSPLLLVALLAGLAWYVKIRLERVPVPKAVGHPLVYALNELEAGKLEGEERVAVEPIHVTSSCKTNYPPDRVKAGYVFAEEPCAGTRVHPHGKVILLTAAKRHPQAVPDLYDLSPEAAWKDLSAAGFAIGEIEPASEPDGWVVVEQKPKKGKPTGPKAVSVTLGQVAAVPDLIGQPPAAGTQKLKAVNLVLGTVSSTHPTHPRSTEVVVAQSPAANMVRPLGTAVEVTLGEPAHRPAHPAPKQQAEAKAEAKPKSKPKPKTKPPPAAAPLPAVGAESAGAAATALANAGLQTRRTLAISATVPAGRLLRTEPPTGAKVRHGAVVTLIVSAGFPEVAVDDGHSVFALDGVSGKRVASIAAGPQQATEPSWSPDGKSIAYVAGGRVMLTSARGAGGPVTLTPAGQTFTLPTFPSSSTAPAVIAAVSQQPESGEESLCLFAVAHSAPSCVPEPGWTLGDSISWAPDGRELLVAATRATPAPGAVGLLEFTSRVPFSADAADWGTGRLATPTTAAAGAGVLAGAFAPDGTQLALVEDFAGPPSLALVASSDLALTKATSVTTPQPACAVQWRADGAELLVQVAGAQSAAGPTCATGPTCAPSPACGSSLGSLYRVDPAQPGALALLAQGVAHPSWQPLPGVG